MDKIELDAKPLSWWLTNAIRRVKIGAFSKNDEIIEYTFEIWKDLAVKQEKEIRELKKLLQAAMDIIDPACEILPDTYDEEIDTFLKLKKEIDDT